MSLAWLAPLLVLGLVVFVHELGHFLAAKICGVYAPRFSLGWGSPLWRWRPKGSETEYVISWLPIGGYVRMASRDDETMSKIEGGGEAPVDNSAHHDKHWDPDAMIPHGPKPIPESRWFESKSTVQRVFILIAGVTMNVILTYVIAVSVIARYGVQVPVSDVIPAVVDTVIAGRPAAVAGFAKGDSVVAIDGKAIEQWADFLREVNSRPADTLQITVNRVGGDRTLTVVTESIVEPDSTGQKRAVGRIGMGPRQPITTRREVTLTEATSLGVVATTNMAVKVVDVVRGLFRGSVGVSQLGGPIAIARASVQTARNGMEDLLTLIAFLSVNLAVLNLLPVPILDGGQILVTLAEGVRGRAFTMKTREYLMKAGVAFILVLFSIVMFNDLKSLVTSWFS